MEDKKGGLRLGGLEEVALANGWDCCRRDHREVGLKVCRNWVVSRLARQALHVHNVRVCLGDLLSTLNTRSTCTILDDKDALIFVQVSESAWAKILYYLDFHRVKGRSDKVCWG